MPFSSKQPPFNSYRAICYALPTLPVYFLYGPLAILQGVYAKYFGLSLSTIATVILFARLFDAVTDPLVGYSADRHYARKGSRKPFIIGGGILFVVASWFLYVPIGFSVEQDKTTVSAGYFMFWFLLFYLAYTVFEIPHLAWGSDLSHHSADKNKVYVLRSFFSMLGGLCFYAIPLLPLFPTNDITPQTLKWAVGLSCILMFPMLYLCIRSVPNSNDDYCHRNNNSELKKQSLYAVITAVFSNGPLLVLMSAFIFVALGATMWAVLLFLFVDTYLNLGGQFALIYVIGASCGILSLQLWYFLANYLGKQTTWAAGIFLLMLGTFGSGFLAPGETAWRSMLICIALVQSGLAASVVGVSLLSDVIDYGSWKYGSDCGATYFSLFSLSNKTVGAIGGAFGFALAGCYGFDPSLIDQSEAAVFGLRLAISWIPTVLLLVSMSFVILVPITARRHRIIRRRLEKGDSSKTHNKISHR